MAKGKSKRKRARSRAEFDDSFKDFDKEFERIRRETSQFPTAFVAIFLFVGLAGLTAALLTGYFALRASQREQSAPGIVVDAIDRRQASGSGSDRFFNYPIVEFTVNGQLQRVEMTSGSAPPQYSPGDRVTILYDPANIQSAYIQDESSALVRWLVPGITGLLGVVFSAVGVLAIWLHRRQQKEIEEEFATDKADRNG